MTRRGNIWEKRPAAVQFDKKQGTKRRKKKRPKKQ
jgi:hypothetical protein